MATINVQVNDVSSGSTGLANVYIVLYDVIANTSTQLQTNASGAISFTGLTAGNYRIYNTGIDTTGQNPPTTCGFPSGFTGTRTPRRLDFTLTAAQTATATFNYDKPVAWSSLNGGNPPNYAIVTNGTAGTAVNLATGAVSSLPNITNNGMGYGLSDNMIYGNLQLVRSDGAGNSTTLSVPNTYSYNGIIGDCDVNSYFYAPNTLNASFTCIDVNPYRTTYLRPMDPYNSFQEVFTAPFTISYTGAPTTTNFNDWSYVDSVKGLVSGTGSTSTMWILSLTTPLAYNVPITGTPMVFGGVSFADLKNFYIPTGSQIRKYVMTTTVAIGSVLSSSTLGVSGDGCRAASAAVFYATPTTVKKVDKAVASVGDTLIYTVTLVNTGIITGNNTVIQDTLPTGLNFVTDSIYVDSIPQPGITLNSIPIGTLPIGQVFTINFSARVTSPTIPLFTNTAQANTSYIDTATSAPYNTTYTSNAANTRNIIPFISTTKQVNKAYGTVGDILLYTIILENTGSDTAINTLLLDTTPIGTTFNANTVQVNGVTIPGATLYPSALDIGTIPVGGTTTVTFKVTVVSIPSNSEVDNNGSLNYNYRDTTTTIPLTGNTNTVATTISVGTLSGITKYVDKGYADCGDTISYTIVLPNSGNVTVTNVIFKDTIPNGTIYIPNSATVDSVSVPFGTTPQTGITVGTIAAGGISTITFQVKVQC